MKDERIRFSQKRAQLAEELSSPISLIHRGPRGIFLRGLKYGTMILGTQSGCEIKDAWSISPLAIVVVFSVAKSLPLSLGVQGTMYESYRRSVYGRRPAPFVLFM